MIDLSSIYPNPLIPQDGYFYVQVLDVDMDQSPNWPQPRICVRVEIHPGHGLGENVILTSTIHPTEKCRYHRTNFLNSFLLPNENDLHLAVGRWGSAYIYRAEHQGTVYSAIKWVYQPIPIRLECTRMNDEHRRGQLPRLPQNDPSPKPQVEPIDMSKGWSFIQKMEHERIDAKLEAKWKKRCPDLPYPRISEAEGV